MPSFGRGGAAAAADPDRAARRTIRLLAFSAFVVVVAVVLRLSLQSLQTTSPSSAKAGGARQARSGPITVTDIGPEPGVDLATYAQNRRGALAAAADDRVAVVSLNAYATEAQARALAGPQPVVALLVAPPDAGPSVVPGSLTAWSSTELKRIREERDEISTLIPTVTDPVFRDFYATEVDRLDKAAGALSPTSAVVFGVVLRGPVAGLRMLGARPEVRLVDVGDGSEPGVKAAYRGLRPEERLKADTPPTRPAS